MCWDSDANAPAPANLSDPDTEGCNHAATANDFHPLPQHALLAEQLQTTLFLSRGFSHHAQRRNTIPEGAGKRIRAERVGTAPTKPAEARPGSDDEHYSSN